MATGKMSPQPGLVGLASVLGKHGAKNPGALAVYAQKKKKKMGALAAHGREHTEKPRDMK